MVEGLALMYGETTGQLRHALGVLAREHRIQQRLGGKGIHTVPETTTVAEREELGKQIRRYRECVLTWSLQAVRAANPRINLEGTSGRSRGPAEELRFRLTEALAASSAEPRHSRRTRRQPALRHARLLASRRPGRCTRRTRLRCRCRLRPAQRSAVHDRPQRCR
ncbi:MAG: hypothetical protein V9F00_17440 [Nocardioides sp.]